MATPRLYLASRSPRRRALLARLGCAFDVLDVDVPEQRAALESPAHYVERVAAAKAEAGWRELGQGAGDWVIGADTEVVLEDRVYGKPADAADATAMLCSLAGRDHSVLSAVELRGPERSYRAQSISTVRFAELDEATIARYVASGEPFGKAGAYAIQGYAECFVVRLCGSYSGVMGLPLHETYQLLRQAGLSPTPYPSAEVDDA